jgi:hypothetical protein
MHTREVCTIIATAMGDKSRGEFADANAAASWHKRAVWLKQY